MARLRGQSSNLRASVRLGVGRSGRTRGGNERSEFAASEAMARPTGFEPVTPRLGIWCSIQLSYGRANPPYSIVGAAE